MSLLQHLRCHFAPDGLSGMSHQFVRPKTIKLHDPKVGSPRSGGTAHRGPARKTTGPAYREPRCDTKSDQHLIAIFGGKAKHTSIQEQRIPVFINVLTSKPQAAHYMGFKH